MQNKKRSKHHIRRYAQKITKRNKQKFGNRIMELKRIAKEEEEKRKKKQKKELKKKLKKTEVTIKKKRSSQTQRKGQTK